MELELDRIRAMTVAESFRTSIALQPSAPGFLWAQLSLPGRSDRLRAVWRRPAERTASSETKNPRGDIIP